MTKVKVLFQKLTSISKKMITLFILPEKWHHTKLRGMHIADDITTDDTTVVLYHDGSTTSTLTFVFLLLARQSPNQFSLCSSFVRRFFVSVVT